LVDILYVGLREVEFLSLTAFFSIIFLYNSRYFLYLSEICKIAAVCRKIATYCTYLLFKTQDVVGCPKPGQC